MVRGALFMREPEQDNLLGKNLRVPNSFFTRHIDSGQAATVMTGTTYIAGDERMMAIRTLQSEQLKMDYPITVATSRQLSSIYGAWHQDLLIRGVGFLLFVLFGATILYSTQKRRRAAYLAKAESETHLLEANAQLENFFNITPDLLCIADTEGHFRKLNPSWETVLGYPMAELENARFLDLVHPEDMAATREAMSALSHGKMVTGFTNRFRHRDGTYRYIEWRTAPHGKLFYAAARDVSQRILSEQAIRRLAYYDALTKLPNRGLLLERLHQEIAHAKRDKTQLALLFIDLDKFKPVNDQYGHQVGDWLLCAVAERIERCIRESDTAARIAGDEFVVLLPRLLTITDAVVIAEKIREVLEQAFFTSEGIQLNISSSIGIAMYPDHAGDAQDLLLLGDEAMYEAKNAGRNRVEIFGMRR